MFYENNLKSYIENVEKIESPEIQLLAQRIIHGATYMLYICHQNKEKYTIMVQNTNILSYKTPQDQLTEMFADHC